MMRGEAQVDVKSIYSNLQNNRESEAMQLNLSNNSRVPAAQLKPARLSLRDCMSGNYVATVQKQDNFKKT